MLHQNHHRSSSRLIAGLTVAVLVLSAAVVRPAAAEPKDRGRLEELTVTATRVEKPLDQVPASVAIVPGQDVQFARPQVGLDEALAKVPGLFMQNRFNFAQDLRVSIRGFGARANFGIRGVKIIVDDIPETLPDGQGQVDTIDLGSVEQITVIRGPASSLYGNASGGVILITSETGAAEPYGDARVAVGEDGYQKYQAKTGGTAGRMSYMLSASDLDFEGYREHSEVESRQLNGQVVFAIDPSSDLRVAFNAADQPVSNDPGALTREQVAEDPHQANAANVNFLAGENLTQQRIGWIYRKAAGERHEFTARNYYVWRDFENTLPFQSGGAVSIDRFLVGGGLSYTNSGTLAGRENRLIVGIDVDRQDDDRRRYDNDFGSIGALTFDQNENLLATGVFLQNELRLRDNLELTAGLRYDEVRFDVDDAFLGDGDDSGERTIDETSPMVGLLYSLSPSINFYANVATAFETPTTAEFADPSGGGGFNPELEPQLATSYEVGVKGLLDARHRYELVLFTIDTKDELIPYELPESPGRSFFRNAGESSRTGVELALATQVNDALGLSLAYTYSDFTFDEFVDDAGNDFAGNEIPGSPRHVLHGEIAYRRPTGAFVALEALYVDEFYANNANTALNDSYVVANLRCGYTVAGERWEWNTFAGANNLFDERYNSNVRINAFGGRYYEPAPEFNLYGGMSVRFR